MSHEKTIDETWTRRFVGAEPRLTEVVEMYEELGFDVRIERASPEDIGGPDCGDCEVATCPDYSAVYTRRATSDD